MVELVSMRERVEIGLHTTRAAYMASLTDCNYISALVVGPISHWRWNSIITENAVFQMSCGGCLKGEPAQKSL